MQVNVSVMLAKLLIGYAPSPTTDSTVDGPSSLPAVRRWTKGEGFEERCAWKTTKEQKRVD